MAYYRIVVFCFVAELVKSFVSRSVSKVLGGRYGIRRLLGGKALYIWLAYKFIDFALSQFLMSGQVLETNHASLAKDGVSVFAVHMANGGHRICLLYTSPSPRDRG